MFQLAKITNGTGDTLTLPYVLEERLIDVA
jgi:hypothetical protein